MQLEANFVFHVNALVGPQLALVFCACTTVPMPGIDPEVVRGVSP